MYILHKKQVIPISLNESWDFFTSPHNLKFITPIHMNFDIIEGGDDKIYPGQIICYKVSPMLRLRLDWVTEIAQVVDRQFFIDEQRFGPYSFWHHKHFFREVEGGTEIEDLVHYKLPLSFLGNLIHSVSVKKQLEHVFDFRQQKLIELFG